MHVDMEFKFVRLRESFSAVFAHAWLFFGVRASNVAVMRRVRSERTLTMLAFEWLLSAVLTYVRAQYRRGRERLHAVWTFVRPLSAVYSHVLVEAGRLRKALSTNRASVRTVFLVYVQHVNT